jgi:hypothetical protein
MPSSGRQTTPVCVWRLQLVPGYDLLDQRRDKKSATFIACLEELLMKEYPTGRVVLVRDNASYHKNASFLAALSLFVHRVMVIWLPPDCSDLNPIERFSRHLKDLACANRLEDNGDSPKGLEPLRAAYPVGLGLVSLVGRRWPRESKPALIGGWIVPPSGLEPLFGP